jgi:hypothetical protein
LKKANKEEEENQEPEESSIGGCSFEQPELSAFNFSLEQFLVSLDIVN